MADVRPGRKLRMHRSVFLALLGLVLILGAAKFCVPWSTARRQQEELDRLRREKAALEAEHKQLSRYKRLLASDQGLESAARREGYVRQGDRRIIFVPAKKAGGRGSAGGGQVGDRESALRPADKPGVRGLPEVDAVEDKPGTGTGP